MKTLIKHLLVCLGRPIELSPGDSLEEMDQKYQEARALKVLENQHKQALDVVFTSKAWGVVKASILAGNCDIESFVQRACEQLAQEAAQIAAEITGPKN
jgi:hypothetical protein